MEGCDRERRAGLVDTWANYLPGNKEIRLALTADSHSLDGGYGGDVMFRFPSVALQRMCFQCFGAHGPHGMRILILTPGALVPARTRRDSRR